MSAQTPPVARSTFVTVVAWIFIVVAGFATLISILQNIMVAMMFPAAEMEKAASQVAAEPNAPWFASIMFNHFRLFFLFILVVSGSTLTAAIGLLLRKNWARLLFVAIMAIGILWNIGGIAIFFAMLSSASDISKPPQWRLDEDFFDTGFKIMLGFNVVLVLLFSSLFGWIIKKLTSEDIKREFVAT